jgi:hypothetical protein
MQNNNIKVKEAKEVKINKQISISYSSSIDTKLSSDLESVYDNIILANEIIDSNEDLQSNEVLKEIIDFLKLMNSKLSNLIQETSNDEIMNICLANNDDMQTTFKR